MTYRPITHAEIPTFTELPSRAFRMDPTRFTERLADGTSRFAYTDCYVWEDGARGIVAGLVSATRTVSVQGAELSTSLLASVSVPPDQRRRGYANAMLRASLEYDRERKLPLSLLFPYSIPFYNRLGYGIVQTVWYLEFPLDELMDFDEIALTRRLTSDDLPAMQRLYDRERPRHSGWLSRTEWEWHERVLDLPQSATWPHRIEGIAVPGEDGELLGYLTYTIAHVEGTQDRVLTLGEWLTDSTREEAWRALAGFVAAQRAQAKFLRYSAPKGFPLVHALRERYTFRDRREMEFVFRDTLVEGPGMMGRIVHLEEALTQRPYPETVTGECVIQMRDPQLPANEEPLHLYIGGGRAAVAPARPGSPAAPPTASADVLTWSELYAGTLTAYEARLLGRLKTDDATTAFLAAAFACEPWFIHRADWF